MGDKILKVSRTNGVYYLSSWHSRFDGYFAQTMYTCYSRRYVYAWMEDVGS